MIQLISTHLTYFGFLNQVKRKLKIEKSLFHLTTWIYKRSDLITKLNINNEIFHDFLRKIENGYIDTQYHNFTHAIDVLQVNDIITASLFI